MGITAEKLDQPIDSVRMEIDEIPKSGAVPIFHDTFLSCAAAHDICGVIRKYGE
jgi:hypothetical protein